MGLLPDDVEDVEESGEKNVMYESLSEEYRNSEVPTSANYYIALFLIYFL
jgi:hypothetical protein